MALDYLDPKKDMIDPDGDERDGPPKKTPQQIADYWLAQLDERGIQAATGSACSTSSDEPSHVLTAIGLESRAISSTIRFSLGRGTRSSDIKYSLKTLFQLLKN